MQWIGLIAAFSATIFWTFSSFAFTTVGRKMSVPTMNLMRLLLGAVLVFVVSFIIEHELVIQIFSHQYFSAWLWLGLSGWITLGIGDYLTYRMLTILGARYGSVFGTLAPASALLFGILLLEEHINPVGLLGMIITIGGIMSMSFSRQERNKIPDAGHGSVWKGILYGVIGALSNGVGLVFSKKGFLEQEAIGFPIQPFTATFMRLFATVTVVILILLFNNKLRRQVHHFSKQPAAVLRTAVLAIFMGPLLAVGSAMISIQYINVAVAQTIFTLVPVWVFLVAHFYYKEIITSKAVVGVVIAVIGVGLLVWRNNLIHWLT
jgi:drug/metabolite transporter (DMT)-like permease